MNLRITCRAAPQACAPLTHSQRPDREPVSLPSTRIGAQIIRSVHDADAIQVPGKRAYRRLRAPRPETPVTLRDEVALVLQRQRAYPDEGGGASARPRILAAGTLADRPVGGRTVRSLHMLQRIVMQARRIKHKPKRGWAGTRRTAGCMR